MLNIPFYTPTVVISADPTSPTRRERERAVRRAELLAAAEALFQEKGYHGTTMAELAKAAELPLATIYTFFPAKEQIYFTLIEERAAELFAAVEEAAAGAEPGLVRLLAVIERVVAFFEAHRAFFQLFIATRSGFEWTVKDDLGEAVNRIYNRHLDLMETIIAEAIERGEVKDHPAAEIAHAVAGLMNAFIFQWVVARTDRPLADQLPVLMDLLLGGIRA